MSPIVASSVNKLRLLGCFSCQSFLLKLSWTGCQRGRCLYAHLHAAPPKPLSCILTTFQGGLLHSVSLQLSLHIQRALFFHHYPVQYCCGAPLYLNLKHLYVSLRMVQLCWSCIKIAQLLLFCVMAVSHHPKQEHEWSCSLGVCPAQRQGQRLQWQKCFPYGLCQSYLGFCLS